MKTDLWVRMEFDAAHTLEGVFPHNHQCARMHGHRYAVILTITATDDDQDVLVDYHELHSGLADIIRCFDHRVLNEAMSRPPTCENLARLIYSMAKKRWPETSSVDVQEQSNTGCRVRG